MRSNTLRVTVGHVRPTFITPIDCQHLDFYSTSQSNFIIHRPQLGGLDDSHLSEYYVLFGLARSLKAKPQNYSNLCVAHYRRFVSMSKFGRTAKNQNYTQLISSDDASEIYQSETIPPNKDWLVGRPLQLEHGGVFAQFARHHPVNDLLRILTAAVDSNLLSHDFLRRFVDARYLFAAPTVGFFPIDYFVDVMSNLEEIVRLCVEGEFPKIQDGYQRRIIAFCLERIHSQILFDYLSKAKEGSVALGYQCVVGDGDVVVASGRNDA